MAKASAAFISIMPAAAVQAGWALCSASDGYASEWFVQAVSQRVSDRWMVVDLQLNGEGRTVTRAVDPEDTVARKVQKAWIASSKSWDRPVQDASDGVQ